MSIHRALAELKTIDARIENALREFEPVGIFQKGRPVVTPSQSSMPAEKHASNAAAFYNAITDLIKNKAAIKCAIVESNTKTRVKVGELEMSVADAITQKSYIVLKKGLLNRMITQARTMQATMNKANEAVEKGKEALLNQSFSKETKPDENTIKAISVPYLEMNTWTLADPLEIQKKIETLTLEISTFEAEVDAVLSESNSLTSITID
jgi:hypothetical protein